MNMSWSAVLVAGAAFGLAHGAHCAGMCGVFAIHAGRRRAGFLTYALGKTSTYLLLGSLGGVAGASVAAFSQPLGIVLGVVVGVALLIGGWRLWRGGPTPQRLLGLDLSPLARILGDLTRRQLPGGRFTLGALTGAIPCGAVYLALLQTSLLGSAAQGAVFMAAFGLGTLPALLGVSLLSKATVARLPARQLVRLGAAGLILAGCLSLARAASPLMHTGEHATDHAPCLLCSP